MGTNGPSTGKGPCSAATIEERSWNSWRWSNVFKPKEREVMTRKRAVLMRDLPIGRRGDQVEVEWLEPPPGFAGFAGWIVYRQGRSVSVEAEDAVRLVDADDPEPETESEPVGKER